VTEQVASGPGRNRGGCECRDVAPLRASEAPPGLEVALLYRPISIAITTVIFRYSGWLLFPAFAATMLAAAI